MNASLIFIAIGIIVCICFSAFFSASEMAYSSCNRVRMENEAEHGNKVAAAVIKILDKFDDTLGAILVGNNLVNIASSSLMSVFIILLTGSDELSWVGTIAITVLVIIFGETVPKITAKKNANRLALAFTGPIRTIGIIFKPIVKLTVGLVHLLTDHMKAEKQDEQEDESVEELHQIIETAEDEGILDSDRTELIQAAIDFADVSASEVMTARVDMHALDIDDPLEEMLKFADKSPYSRLPVYEESIDHIIGTLSVKNLFLAVAEGEPFEVRELLHPVVYVYKTMKLPAVLDALRDSKQHLAIVTDEYSGTLGVITLEDVLEKIVGDIWDETDTIEEEVVVRGDDAVEVDGDMNIYDFIELMHENEEEFECESDTVGGWVIEKLERFPGVGDSFAYNDFTVTVTGVDGRRVESILVKKKAPEAGEAAEEKK